MAHKNRDKDFWLIPKRANLHQSVVLLNGILELNYHGKTWNASKQDRLGSYLGKKGATKSGKNITPQSLRTLLASIPQYFGFTFINTDTTPNTLFVTEAGNVIVEELKSFLDNYDFESLISAEKEEGTINYSETYLKQFLKLQLTNPVLLKDCEGVLIFPLTFTLKVLKKTKYLTFEEIALFIFRSKSHNDENFVALEIENFRRLDYQRQLRLVEVFKQTHLGNISLVKAPTTSYYQKLCSYTGLIRKSSIIIEGEREKRKVNTIEITPEKESTVNGLLEKYDFQPYDFKDNLSLWLQYIGNTKVFRTPKDITVTNRTNNEQLVVISENDSIIDGNLIKPNDSISFPCIEHNKYKVKIYDKTNGSIVKTIDYTYSRIERIFIDNVNDNHNNLLDINGIEKEIIEHIDSSDFSTYYLNYISIISEILDKNLRRSKNLRGSRLEYLFFRYFEKLQDNEIIDEVIWNGKIGRYGIPSPSPGGPTGSPDILLFIDEMIIVVELTTIKSKSQQWSSEGASVPDHIRLIEENYRNKKIYALYLAPIIHEERVTKGMISRLRDYESKLYCMQISEFLKISKKFRKKNDIKKFFNSI